MTQGHDPQDEDCLIEPDFFISVCGGLIVVGETHSAGHFFHMDFSPEIRFVHLTTEEFFRRNAEKYFYHSKCSIALACVTQLRKEPIDPDVIRGEEIVGESIDGLTWLQRELSSFCRYSVVYAVPHAMLVEDSSVSEALELLWADKEALRGARHAWLHLWGEFGRRRFGSSRSPFKPEMVKATLGPYPELSPLQLSVYLSHNRRSEALLAASISLGEGADPESSKKPDFAPALCIAALRNNLHMLNLLIEAGARADHVIDDVDSDVLDARYARLRRCDTSDDTFLAYEGRRSGKTILRRMKGHQLSVLDCAILRNDLHMAELLVKLFQPVLTARLGRTRSSLQFAASLVQPRMVNMLLENGLDVNEKNNLKENALHYLANSKTGDIEALVTVAELLIEVKIDGNVTDAWGRTPLTWARKSEQRQPQMSDLIQMLKENGCVEKVDYLLIPSIKMPDLSLQDLSLARDMIATGADVHVVDESTGAGVLQVFLSEKVSFDGDLAKVLVKRGASIVSEYQGESALHWIIRHLGELIANDTWEDVQEYQKKHVLHEKWRQKHVQVLTLLLEKSTEIDVPYIGMTALYMAADWGEEDMVVKLLTAGADATIKGPRGTPLEVAAKLCYPRIVERLLEKNPCIEVGLVDKVRASSLSPSSSEDPSTYRKDKLETLQLLCAHAGWALEPSDDLSLADTSSNDSSSLQPASPEYLYCRPGEDSSEDSDAGESTEANASISN